jgi:5-methylcytosine-specific restriction enzyme B
MVSHELSGDPESMSASILDPQLFSELKAALDRGMASGDVMTPTQIEQQTMLFRNRFGPAVLRGLDGEALLRLMHGRESSESRCLAYWLEFKNDDEFTSNRFGGIGGGSALKFWHLPAPKRWCLDDRVTVDAAISVSRRVRQAGQTN